MALVASPHVALIHNFSKSARAEAAGTRIDEAVADSSVATPRGDVIATLDFYGPAQDSSGLFNFVETPPGWQPQPNHGTFSTSVTIHDIRGREDEYNFDKDAVKVIQNVPESAEKDFISDESIEKHYYPEVEKLLLENVPGSYRVFIFDHTIRRTNKAFGVKRGPVLKTHIDQTPLGARERVKQHLGDDADKLLQGRYRIINVWQPLNGPVVSFPLAFASSETVEYADLIPIDNRFADQAYWLRHNPGQKWLYLSGMKNDEILLLELFDSEGLVEGSTVKGGRLPHSAFEDPRTPAGAPLRDSIEVRTLVFGP